MNAQSMGDAAYQDQVVYVVGGSAGIGLASARAFAARGAHVLVFARHQEGLERAVAEIRACRRSEAQRVDHRSLDVGEPERVAAVMPEAVAGFGPPDVLLNCAGRARPARFEDVSYPQFRESLRVNLHGTWNTTQALLPQLKQTRGYLINTASLAGLIGVFGYTDYAASKFAVVGFTQALRSELKRFGIRVSVLCPPDTDTPGFAEENRAKPLETHAVSASARLLSADQVAEALLVGMRRGRFLIVPGGAARLLVLAQRLAPGLLEHWLDRVIRKASGD